MQRQKQTDLTHIHLWKTICFLVFGVLFCTQMVLGQSDTLVLDDQIRVVGEIKKMEKGVLEIDVPYGDEVFKIKWSSIKEIHTESRFLVSLRDMLYNGRVSSTADGRIRVYDKDTLFAEGHLKEIVYLNQIKEGFANRFSAAVELGFNVTKAQDMRQFSFRSSAGYKSDSWWLEASYNMIRSSQDNTEPIQRTDGLLNYRRLLFRKWYGIATLSTLSNTEQLIDIRANTQLGAGNYLLSTNKLHWGIKAGVNNNYELFSNDPESRTSWEGFLGTELNIYGARDLDLSIIYMGYSGITEEGRYRADVTFDLKYDLPLDFFIRLGVAYNYDNRPAENASQVDYVFRTGIGWEW
ncbi:Protein of unknown function, DUF481 [Muriicola jejuensis]|uniref:DUF481 domain-containing protein n=1 Tax=Muriicola jejuensis TaxID=504488 RepID=A0A6P0UGE9_9FLAO|nr:DUF481 domain-containing protein [Muriicola jejuensis]NER11702.1 DUF481 domain-containing protein [Muriicola jejuensis]SMP25395.1 Protein of unknown function, DUF481 [Muriicola jejuensis]